MDSAIEQTQEYLATLRTFALDAEEQPGAGYVAQQLTDAQIKDKRRCKRCHKILSKSFKETEPTTRNGSSASEEPVKDQPGKVLVDNAGKPILRCAFHSGRVQYGRWSCCQKPPYSKPCERQPNHVPLLYSHGELEKNWRFYRTPSSPDGRHVAAVTIDCEMGTAASGETELIRVSLIDYFTRTVLVDSLVYPNVQMSHFNTPWSGLTRRHLEDAKRAKKCFFGRDKARKEIWKYVGPETIVVGHAGNGDLASLRWTHPLVADTFVIEGDIKALEDAEKEAQREAEAEAEAEAMGDPIDATEAPEVEAPEQANGAPPQKTKKGGPLSLKGLTLRRLGRHIQPKGKGHDSVEDALATRDLMHWHVTEKMKPVEEKVDAVEDGQDYAFIGTTYLTSKFEQLLSS